MTYMFQQITRTRAYHNKNQKPIILKYSQISVTGRTICKVHFNCFLYQKKTFFYSAHPYLIAVFFSLKSLNKISIPPVSFIEGSDWWVYIQVFYFHLLGMGLYLLIAMTILGWTTTNVLCIQTENLYKTSYKPIYIMQKWNCTWNTSFY